MRNQVAPTSIVVVETRTVADLAEQVLGAARHPLADAVEDGLEPRRGERAPEAADLADGVEGVESGATGCLHDDGSGGERRRRREMNAERISAAPCRCGRRS